jgi:hypothetical protein
MEKLLLTIALFSLTMSYQTIMADVIGKIPLGSKSNENSMIEFAFPDGWFPNKEKNPFDLQYFSQFEQLTTGVFLYKKIDLSSSYTARKLLDVHVNDLKSKRKKFEILEAEKEFKSGDMNIITVTYSGEKGISRNYYKFSVIESKKPADAYLVILQTIIPSQWDKKKNTLEKIIKSVQIK